METKYLLFGLRTFVPHTFVPKSLFSKSKGYLLPGGLPQIRREEKSREQKSRWTKVLPVTHDLLAWGTNTWAKMSSEQNLGNKSCHAKNLLVVNQKGKTWNLLENQWMTVLKLRMSPLSFPAKEYFWITPKFGSRRVWGGHDTGWVRLGNLTTLSSSKGWKSLDPKL